MLLLLERGQPHLWWRRGAGLLDGRWQSSIRGRSGGRARSGDATRKRFLSGLWKPLIGSAE
jgi:hypothetical protein